MTNDKNFRYNSSERLFLFFGINSNVNFLTTSWCTSPRAKPPATSCKYWVECPLEIPTLTSNARPTCRMVPRLLLFEPNGGIPWTWFDPSPTDCQAEVVQSMPGRRLATFSQKHGLCTFRCFGVSVFRCFGVLVFRCSGVLVFRCSGVQVFRRCSGVKEVFGCLGV